jgi:hypothetical protein
MRCKYAFNKRIFVLFDSRLETDFFFDAGLAVPALGGVSAQLNPELLSSFAPRGVDRLSGNSDSFVVLLRRVGMLRSVDSLVTGGFDTVCVAMMGSNSSQNLHILTIASGTVQNEQSKMK